MKKLIILTVLLLGCSHSRHLTKSGKTVKTDSTVSGKAEVHAEIKTASNSLIDVSSLTASKDRDLSIIETKTESGAPIVLTGNFKIDSAKGGGIELSSGDIKLTAKYDPKTGLIKAEVYAKGHGKQTTYTREINLKDKENLSAKDSTAKQNKDSLKSFDSTGQNRAHLAAKTKEKDKQVDSKTKWPVFQVLGLGFGIAAIILLLAKWPNIRKWIIGQFKPKGQ